MNRLRLLRGAWLPLILLAAASGCATSMLRQAQNADLARDHDLAVAKYMAVLREDPDNRDAMLGLDRAKLRASEEHFARGRRLHALGRYEDAAVELQLATELNPTNQVAEQQLRQVRLALRTQLARPEGGATELESLLNRTRDLAPAGFELPTTVLPAVATGTQSTSRLVYFTIATLAGLSVTFDSAFREVPAPVSLLSGLTVRQALDAVARGTSTFYQLTGPASIVVVNDTPAKRREYADEVVRQFPVQNADLKETMDALRVVADARYISAVTGTNAIVVRDTAERVQVIGRLLAAFDKARPELVVDVEILEIDRNRLRDYGLQIASPGSTGIDGSVAVIPNPITLQTLRNLSQANILLTNIPALYYRLLKTDIRTRILANPHLRMTDGVAAVARFGQRVPVPNTRIAPITQGGLEIQPQTSFLYENIGVNIGMTSRTHANDEVTLALTVELSSIGPPGFDGLPTFGNRNVTTVIRLRDGETNILAGLIREDERVDRQTIPGLGDVPVLGSLFARNRREAQETDVVIMLTPHIVRVLDVQEADLQPLRLPREGAGGGLGFIEGPAIVPPISVPPPPPASQPQPLQPQLPPQPQPQPLQPQPGRVGGAP